MKQKRLPVLELSKYFSQRDVFVEELRQVCHHVGFFLVQHDLSEGCAEHMLQETKQFFSRELEEKNEISYRNNTSFRGYMPMGVEQTSGVVDRREQIEYAAEYTRPGATWPVYERLKQTTNPWPDFQPSLRSASLLFAKESCHVADCIRNSLGQALFGSGDDGKQPFHNFQSKFRANEDCNEMPHWVLKLISYPSADKSRAIATSQPQGEEVLAEPAPSEQGVGAHTDTNFLTMVLQDTIGGLQVFSQGEWIDVPTEYGTDVLVCNLGEQAETWSRGYFLATPHRVLRNSSTSNTRTSVPLFYNPVLSAVMDPVEKRDIQAKWERKEDQRHWRRKDNAMITSVGENTFKSLARSHREAFEKNHSDLFVLADGRIQRK